MTFKKLFMKAILPVLILGAEFGISLLIIRVRNMPQEIQVIIITGIITLIAEIISHKKEKKIWKKI